MIACVVICHHQNPAPMLKATQQWAPHRLLVVDRSPEVDTKGWDLVYRIDQGKGFQAGLARRTGIRIVMERWNPSGVVCFDGDRIPTGKFTELPGYDCVLWSSENDSRKSLYGDCTDACASIDSPFYSAGFYLSRELINRLGTNEIFDPDFDGMWGWEDTNLGDRIVQAGFRIWLSESLKISGALEDPEFIKTASEDDPKFRNWWLRLKKRKELMSEKNPKEQLLAAFNQASLTIHNSVPMALNQMATAMRAMNERCEELQSQNESLKAELENLKAPRGKSAKDGSRVRH